MSKHKIREDKTCTNCGRFVAEHFCPNCGQENTEVRHSFIYLLKHFVSDLLHYDSSLWSTTKLLLFSPATLSKEYIGGRRKKYVDPIKLYIFISFIAFFIPGILPEKSNNHENRTESILKVNTTYPTETSTTPITINIGRNITENSELASTKPLKGKSYTKYYIKKALLKITRDKSKDKQTKVNEFILHNLPKVLFVYMPIFAFWLWLFNSKKKFLYFDSAIFTLHYFSFLLLSITIVILLNTAFEWLNLPDTFSSIVNAVVFSYAVFYFFRANRLFYGNKRWIANTKAFIIFWIDILLIFIILILYAVLAMLIV
ncbi:uncharacterized protein DUF3667 [Dysgonomonas alginatilytica]|uniref:Uncharacterized protein DUF3667 n=1 Tax=Dysgonomonas alginatilytica TaxID=1605892 RepID=A0A2V3PVI4_9BACT|nr:DUF3667 domain-containing protein [Dysgonomonas alginatilytica]PXV69142.1 uncharacterized protein DUF3667 [Dysgonomonas alginatilytica]